MATVEIDGVVVKEVTDFEPRHSCLKQATLVSLHLFREVFGVDKYEQNGHFVDEGMTALIHAYLDWVGYPKGDSDLNGAGFSLAFSPDGQYLYSHHLKCFTEWNLSKYTISGRWFTETETLNDLDCHSNLLACATLSSEVWIYNIDDRKMIHRWKCKENSIESVKFSHDGSKVASPVASGIHIWCIKTGIILHKLVGHTGPVYDLTWMDNHQLTSVSRDSSIRSWDVDQISMCVDIQSIHPKINFVSFNSDRNIVALCFTDRIEIMHWPNKEMIISIQGTFILQCFHPSIPNIMALNYFHEKPIHLIKISETKKEAEMTTLMTVRDDGEELAKMIFTPDGQRLISVSESLFITFWDISDIYS